MDYTNLVKSLQLPAGFAAPAELRYDDIRARAISRADLAADVKGINARDSSVGLTRRPSGMAVN